MMVPPLLCVRRSAKHSIRSGHLPPNQPVCLADSIYRASAPYSPRQTSRDPRAYTATHVRICHAMRFNVPGSTRLLQMESHLSVAILVVPFKAQPGAKEDAERPRRRITRKKARQ